MEREWVTGRKLEMGNEREKGLGLVLSFRMFHFTSVEPALSLKKVHPDKADSNCKWCIFLQNWEK